MPSILNPYLSFKDNANDAMAFYKTVFGGDLTSMTFAQGGMIQEGPERDKIMHAQLTVPNGMVLMGSDSPEHMGEPRPNGSISLSGDNDPELRGYWTKLLDGGHAVMPLEVAPWGDAFGMLTDKFGVSWMVNIAGKKA